MRIKVWIAKKLSRVSTKAIWIVFAAIFVSVVIVPIIAWLSPSSKESCFSQIWVDFFSSTSLRNIAYGGDNMGFWSAFAYAFGVILILGILVPVVTNRLRTLGDRYLNGTMDTYYWKNHALFIGCDELMVGTLKKACSDYDLVVVAVSSDVQETREQLSRYLSKNMEKIEIVQCNQNNIDDLENKACIMEASKIFIIGQPDNPTHDAYNLRTLADIAKKWNDKEQTDQKAIPHIMVYLRNQSTFSLLQRQGFLAENLWNIISDPLKNEDKKKAAQTFVDHHCEYFNFFCDKALQLLTDKDGISLSWHSPKKNLAVNGMENRQVHFVVLGMTPMGTALVRELLKLAHPSGIGTKLLITMVDENAYEEMHYFIGRTKELFKLCHYRYFDYNNPDKNSEFKPKPNDDFLDVEFEFIQCDVAHPRLTNDLFAWSADEKQLLTLAICTDDSPKNMAVAMYLPPEMLCGENSVPTWVYQEGDDSVRQLLDCKKYPDLHPFSIADHVVASTANSPIYDWDKTIIKYYEEHYKTNKVAERWENKKQKDRWSSLYNVKSIGVKLRAVDADVTQDIEESKKLLIDYYEHNRWVVERLTMGSRPTNAEQHALVVEELKRQLEKHPDWRPKDDSHSEKVRSAEVCQEIDKCRTEFKKLKNGEGENSKGIIIHDDIRPFEDLDDFTKYKDRKTLDDYIESIRQNPKKD